jgi:SAM-dependent methyltransferase
VLDVGAGAGELVYLLRRLGYDASGIEPNEGYARFATEILSVRVFHGFYHASKIPLETYDAVLMYHVLEHLEDPLDAVSHAGKWLKARGLLVIEVPNVEAVCQWPGHRFHRAHLYSFNPPALEQLLKKAGYAIRDRQLSSDGGNITVVGEKDDPPRGFSKAQIEGNCDRVLALLRLHTNLRHLLSGYPLQRVFSKLGQHLHEFRKTRGRPAGREILDELIRETFDTGAPSPRE